MSDSKTKLWPQWFVSIPSSKQIIKALQYVQRYGCISDYSMTDQHPTREETIIYQRMSKLISDSSFYYRENYNDARLNIMNDALNELRKLIQEV